MRKFSRITSLAVIISLLVSIMPQTLFMSMNNVQAMGVLTREDAKKFEGMIAVGYKHSVILQTDGQVVGSGDNVYGQTQVDHWQDIKSVDAGDFHTVGLKNDGTVVASGRNNYGEINIDDWENIVSISAGYEHTTGLKSDGTVVAVGRSSCGATDVQNWEGIVAVSAGFTNTIGLKSDGTVVSTPSKCNSGFSVAGWSDIVAISSGDDHILGLKSDGTVVATGNTYYGGTNVSDWKNIVSISAGYRSSLGLVSDGTIVSVGENTYGQTNVSEWKNMIAISTGQGSAVGLGSNGATSLTGFVSEENINDNFNLDLISTNKKIVKPNDTVNITLKDNDSFFTVQDNRYELSSNSVVLSEGEMTPISENERTISYKVQENSFGNVDIRLPGVIDIFGVNLYTQDLFTVIPLESITSTSSDVKSGDKITLTATFYESVTSDFKLSLNGAVELSDASMNEVAGSDGKKFILQYTVLNGYQEGTVNATLSNITTKEGSNYSSYVEGNIFNKNNRIAPISSLDVSKEIGKIGDEIVITANFSESIIPGVKLSLKGGITLVQAPMTEVEGSDGQVYTYTYRLSEGDSGSIHASITEVVDLNNNLSQEYVQENIFIADGIKPTVTDLVATPTIGKLGNKILITATFSEPIKPNVELSLSNGATMQSEVMTAVEGSNGMIYQHEYIVKNSDMGSVSASINNIEDQVGNLNSYNQNIFETDGIKPEVVSIKTNSTTYETGDYVHILVSFSEKVKSQIKIKFSGGINNEEYQMSEVAGSGGKDYELYYEIKAGQYRYVHAELLNIEDSVGNGNTFAKSNLLYIHDPSNANLSNISLTSDTQNYILTPNFSADVYQYSIEVDDSITDVNVNAHSQDPYTIVKGIGNKNITVGKNLITLTSTSKNGTVKTYDIIVTVNDLTGPSIPTVNEVTDKSTSVNGTAESHALITIKVGTIVIGTGTVDSGGDYTVTIPVQNAGTTLSVTATDNVGNTSETKEVTVKDVTAPLQPTVNKLTDKSEVVTGTAEIGSTITIKSGTTFVGTGKTTVEGNYSVVIPNQNAEKVLTITATDAAGNVSAETKVTITKSVPEVTNRIAGEDRYATAVSISNEGWETAETVILATGTNFPDALAGGPLAYKENAPILLTRPTRLVEVTELEIKRLNAKKVIILGSEGAVSLDVESKLKDMGLVVERIGGENRFETAALIAKRLPSEQAIIAFGYNFPDVLSISPYAAKNGIPILLTRSDRVPAETLNAMANKNNTIIVGSTSVISENVAQQFPQPVRYGGATRFDTGKEIITQLPMGTGKAYIATGRNFPDALAGSVLAAKNNAPILLVNQTTIPTAMKDLILNYDSFSIFGSEVAVGEDIKNELDQSLTGE